MIFQILTCLVPSVLLIRHQWLAHRTRRSVKEWYQEQSLSSAQEVNLLRESSLQELAAIRRGLELAADCPLDRDFHQYQGWIQQLESLHHALNSLIDNLVPPFATDSLPLALSVHLEKVKSARPDFDFFIECADDWELIEPLSTSKAILLFFQELAADADTFQDIGSLELAFTQVSTDKCLTAKLNCEKSGNAVKISKKVSDLCRMISFLSAVECHFSLKGEHLFLKFYWNRWEKR